MVIARPMTEMKDPTAAGSNPTALLRRDSKVRANLSHRMTRNVSNILKNKKNTKAEFKRLKTILPSIRRKEHVSKLDIILEAIKYIDDLQDQLIDRLSGPRLDRESTLLAIASTSSAVSIDNNDVIDCFKMQSDSEDEDDDVFSLSDGYMSDPGLVSFDGVCSGYDSEDDDDNNSSGCHSNASVDL